jgi:hypothetical protein
MKTFYKVALTHEKARQKQIELETKTGVKWDFYSANGGTCFTPVVTKETPIDDTLANVLEGYLTKEYQAFVKLSEKSGMEIKDVLIAAKTLAKNGKATATVNRMGNFAAIRIR